MSNRSSKADLREEAVNRQRGSKGLSAEVSGGLSAEVSSGLRDYRREVGVVMPSLSHRQMSAKTTEREPNVRTNFVSCWPAIRRLN